MTILTTNVIPLVKPTTASGPPRIRSSEHAPATQPVTPDQEASTDQAKATVSQLEQVQQALDRLKQSIKPTLANTLEFQIDNSTGKAVVMIRDKETNALVRQIPSEEVLTIARALDRLQGRGGLVKQQA